MEEAPEVARGKKLLELHAHTLSVASSAALSHIERGDFNKADETIRAMHSLGTREKTLEFKIFKNFSGDEKEEIIAHLKGINGNIVTLPSGRADFPTDPASINKIRESLGEIRDSSDQIASIIGGPSKIKAPDEREAKVLEIKARLLMNKLKAEKQKIVQEEIPDE